MGRDFQQWTIGERDRVRRLRWALALVVGLALAVGVGLILPT
jgi:hypothetical protein